LALRFGLQSGCFSESTTTRTHTDNNRKTIVTASGQLESKTLPSGQGQLDYTYYAETAASGAGLLHTIEAPDGSVLIYTYAGQLPLQEAWDGSAVAGGGVSGSVERIYDNHLRVAAQTVNSEDVISFGYDADGFMTGAGALAMSRDAQNGLLEGTTLGEVSDAYGRNGFGEVMEYTATLDRAHFAIFPNSPVITEAGRGR
jgi:hypothetical protein